MSRFLFTVIFPHLPAQVTVLQYERKLLVMVIRQSIKHRCLISVRDSGILIYHHASPVSWHPCLHKDFLVCDSSILPSSHPMVCLPSPSAAATCLPYLWQTCANVERRMVSQNNCDYKKELSPFSTSFYDVGTGLHRFSSTPFVKCLFVGLRLKKMDNKYQQNAYISKRGFCRKCSCLESFCLLALQDHRD